jgi:translocation and assembly module TamB
MIAGRVRVDALSARGAGTLESHVVRLASDGEGFDAHAELRGGWTAGQGWRGELERLVNAGRYPLRLEAPVALRISPQAIDVGELRARLGAGYLRVDTVEWEPGRLATRGQFAGLPARWAIVAAGLHDALRSTLLLDGRWDFASLEAIGRDTPVLQGRVQVRRASGDLEVLEPSLALGMRAAALDVRFEEGRIGASLDIDSALGEAHAKASAGGWASDSPLELQARLDVADIRALLAGLPPELRLTGRAAATVRGRGTVGEPALAGTLTADGLSVHVPPYGIYLEDGVLRASLQGDALQVERFTLRGGKGQLTAEGRLPFGKGAAGAELRWVASQLQVLARPDMRLVLSGAGAATLQDRRAALQGELRVENGYVERGFEQLPTLGDDVVVVNGPLEKDSRTGARQRMPLDLSLLVNLGENFKVRLEGFDGLLRGELRLTTDAQGALRANGRIRAADATFRAYGRTLNVDPGVVIFDGPPDNPSLQIEAWRKNQEVAAGVRVTGTLEQPRVELVSEPPLPEGAKLSWLVLGHPPSEATGGDVALLQTAASALLGRGNSVPLTTRVADQLGVDELSLRGSAELENRVVAVGKRLSDRLYVTYEQGVGAVAQNLVKIDLSLTERISLRGQAGTTSGAGVFYRYSWD